MNWMKFQSLQGQRCMQKRENLHTTILDRTNSRLQFCNPGRLQFYQESRTFLTFPLPPYLQTAASGWGSGWRLETENQPVSVSALPSTTPTRSIWIRGWSGPEERRRSKVELKRWHHVIFQLEWTLNYLGKIRFTEMPKILSKVEKELFHRWTPMGLDEKE